MDGSNYASISRRKGLGLHNDLQNEHSIVGNLPFVLMFEAFGTVAQQEKFIAGAFHGETRVAFGLTEAAHGSDATHMETVAVREVRDGVAGWRIDGEKMWITGMHVATHCATFARTAGNAGDARGISCFLVPTGTPGMKIEEYIWTFNMPTDHPRLSFTGVWVPEEAAFGPPDNGLPWRSRSCIKTGSGRRLRRWERRLIALRRALRMRGSENHLAKNWRATRLSNGHWWN